MGPQACNTPPFDRRLNLLRQRFLGGLVPRVLLLEQQCNLLRKNESDGEALQAIRSECHKLAGVSASFGFHDIGAMAGQIDIGLSSGSLTWKELEPQLENLMDIMELHLENAFDET